MPNPPKALVVPIAAAVLGTVSWLHPLALLLALALPALLHCPPQHGRAAQWFRGWRWPVLIATAWWLPGNLTLAPVVQAYFGATASPLLVAGLPLGLTVLQAAPFAVINPASPGAAHKAARMATALALTILPPFGLSFWRNPLYLSGVLLPSTGALGLLLLIAVMSALASRRSIRFTAPVLIALGMFSLVLNAAYLRNESPAQHRSASDSPRWIALSTEYPGTVPVPGARGAALVVTITPHLRYGTVIVLPESVLAPITDADRVELNVLDVRAKNVGATVLLGVSTQHDADGYWRNGVLAIGALRGWVHDVQIPMLAGHWRPVPGLGGVRANLFGSDLVTLPQGVASISVCYEDFIVWPHRGLLTGKAGIMISMGNRWALSGTYAARAQDVAALLMARLSGAQLVRATNEWRG